MSSLLFLAFFLAKLFDQLFQCVRPAWMLERCSLSFRLRLVTGLFLGSVCCVIIHLLLQKFGAPAGDQTQALALKERCSILELQGHYYFVVEPGLNPGLPKNVSPPGGSTIALHLLHRNAG